MFPLYSVFLDNVKRFGYKIGIQFIKIVLVVEKNNCATKIINTYAVYDLDNWPSFILKNFLFGSSNIVRNSDKSKFV